MGLRFKFRWLGRLFLSRRINPRPYRSQSFLTAWVEIATAHASQPLMQALIERLERLERPKLPASRLAVYLLVLNEIH